MKLTHQATHIYQMTSFDVPTAQYFSTEGNDSITLAKSGFYNANYSFTNDANGGNPAGWTIIENTGTHVDVIAEKFGHTKVAELWDNHAGNYASMQNTFTTQNVGTIEFWWAKHDGTNSTNNFVIKVQDDTDAILNWYYTEGDLVTSDVEGTTLIANPQNDTWYHIRIDFNCTSDKYTVYINQAFIVTMNFDNLVDAVTKARFYTQSLGTNYNFYAWIDAVDYSWASGYSLYRSYDEYYTTSGSYVSPVLDLGVANNYYYNTLTCYVETPGDSDIDLETSVSLDNISWTGFSPTPLNCTFNFEMARYVRFFLNLTASSDLLETPMFRELNLSWTETILNEMPQLGTISVAFDNDTMQANITCMVTDPDNDTMDVYLCLLLGTLVANQTSVLNGTIMSFVLTCEYDSAYEYYINVTDSEDSVQSSVFGFTTGAEPEALISTSTMTLLGVAVILGICAAIFVCIPRKHI